MLARTTPHWDAPLFQEPGLLMAEIKKAIPRQDGPD
jgi:hypothetical protein